MNFLANLRALARINRTPKYATGGRIIGPRPSNGEVPAILSHGCTLVPGQVVGTDHPVVVVQGDRWEPVDRDDRPEWVTEAAWDRIAREGK